MFNQRTLALTQRNGGHFYKLMILLLSRRLRQRERLSASVLSICPSVRLFVCLSVAKMQKRDFLKKLSNLQL